MGFNSGFKGLNISGPGSSVGITTGYGLDGPGIESRWKRVFPHPSRPALGPTQPPTQWVQVSLPGVKRPGRGVDYPPPSSAEVKERVALYLYSCPDGPCSPPSLLYNWYRVFPGGKERPGRDTDPSPPSSSVGHERVELYLYSACGPYDLYRATVPVQG